MMRHMVRVAPALRMTAIAGMAAVLITWAGSVAMAQKVKSAEEFGRSMQMIGVAIADLEQEIGENAVMDAKVSAALARQVLAGATTYLTDEGMDDAVETARQTLTELDALDGVLSAASVDPAAATAGLRDVKDSCEACHEAYREGDADSGYRIKTAL